MLVQERAVRESYVGEVLDATGDPELRRQIWMMGQPDGVRASYVREVLEPLLDVSDGPGPGTRDPQVNDSWRPEP